MTTTTPFTPKSTFHVFETKAALCEALGRLFLECQQKAHRQDQVFRVALSGGSLPELLGQALIPHQSLVQKVEWQAFLADERCVPDDHPENNGHQLDMHVFQPLNLKASHFQFFRAPQEVDPTLCAEKYQLLMKASQPKSASIQDPSLASNQTFVFDLILLGMGPDGHTCSLFPNHRLLTQSLPPSMAWVAPISDSPKPPPERITLTLPILNQAQTICFVCTGAAKSEVVECIRKRPLEAQQKYPAALVQPKEGQVIWLLDKEAGAKL